MTGGKHTEIGLHCSTRQAQSCTCYYRRMSIMTAFWFWCLNLFSLCQSCVCTS